VATATDIDPVSSGFKGAEERIFDLKEAELIEIDA
jgi:hypothetical protein